MIGCKCDICEIMTVFLSMDGWIGARPWTKAFPGRRSFRTATQQYVLLFGMAGIYPPKGRITRSDPDKPQECGNAVKLLGFIAGLGPVGGPGLPVRRAGCGPFERRMGHQAFQCVFDQRCIV